MDHFQSGDSNPGSDPSAVELIDEPADDVVVPAHRLAGVGAALGSCFSLMVVVLVISGAGSLSRPRAGLAAEDSDDSTEVSTQPPLASVGTGSVVPIEDRLRIESLERAAMLARAEVQAAETRLAMLRSDVERRALERAEGERAKAEQVESNGSPYEWMTTEQLAARTRDRARSQLDVDFAAVQSLRTSAEGELTRLREAADAAEQALAAARADLAARMKGFTPAISAEPVNEPSIALDEPHPAPTAEADLTDLIKRHHASLVEAPSTVAAGD